MSPLAFDKQGKPFSWHRRTTKLLARVFRTPSGRGTCAQVLDAQGEPLYVDAEIDYLSFRKAIGNVPGLYRLDQCDEDGTQIDDAPPAYVSIDVGRNAVSNGSSDGEVNPLVIIEHMFATHADVMKTMAMQQANIMAASAEILRAPLRPALAVASPAVERDDDEEDEPTVVVEELEVEPDPWAAWRPLLQMAEPHLPKLGAFLYEQFTAYLKTTATPPAAAPVTTPAPAPTAPTAVPSSAPEPTSAAAGSSASDVADRRATVAQHHVPARTMPNSADDAPDPTAAIPSATEPAASTTEVPADAGDTTGGPTTPREPDITTADVMSAPSTALAPVTHEDDAGTAALRNTATPTPEQWQHLFAIRHRLSDEERSKAETLIALLGPDVRAQFLAELSVLSVDDAVRALRTTMRRLAVTTRR
jgi:hypothetical protein